ncbi:MAG: hypothetical protein LBL99_02925 [Holosporaceae bacterium]|jgi:hypothetical protein|nr:hypothetical protein [Holosporaceae bacterium]
MELKSDATIEKLKNLSPKAIEKVKKDIIKKEAEEDEEALQLIYPEEHPAEVDYIKRPVRILDLRNLYEKNLIELCGYEYPKSETTVEKIKDDLEIRKTECVNKCYQDLKKNDPDEYKRICEDFAAINRFADANILEVLRTLYPIGDIVDYIDSNCVYSLIKSVLIYHGINPTITRKAYEDRFFLRTSECEQVSVVADGDYEIKPLTKTATAVYAAIKDKDKTLKYENLEATKKTNNDQDRAFALDYDVFRIRLSDFIELTNTKWKLPPICESTMKLLDEAKQNDIKEESRQESPKTINLLYKIIAALISNYCRINPSKAADKLPTYLTGHIKKILSNFGIKLSDETIRKHIKQAYSVLSEECPDFKETTHFTKLIYTDSTEDNKKQTSFIA